MIDITAPNFEFGILTSETHKRLVFIPQMEVPTPQGPVLAPIGLRIIFDLDRLAAAKVASELAGDVIDVEDEDKNGAAVPLMKIPKERPKH